MGRAVTDFTRGFMACSLRSGQGFDREDGLALDGQGPVPPPGNAPQFDPGLYQTDLLARKLPVDDVTAVDGETASSPAYIAWMCGR